MAVGDADARDLSQMAERDLFAQELVERQAALEIAGLEEDAGPLHRGRHAISIGGRQAERLLDEHVLAGRRSRQH